MSKEIAALLENEDRLRAMAKAAFDQVDGDRSGFIDRGELATVMSQVAKTLRTTPPTQSEIDTVMREIDTDQDGQVSFTEYLELVRRTLQKLVRGKREGTSPEPPRAEEESKSEEVMRQVRMFERYLEDTGLTKAFQIIFAEIISKKIEPTNVFAYSAMRLRQIGKEIAHLLPANLTAHLADEPANP